MEQTSKVADSSSRAPISGAAFQARLARKSRLYMTLRAARTCEWMRGRALRRIDECAAGFAEELQ